jgi:hypothetical protein
MQRIHNISTTYPDGSTEVQTYYEAVSPAQRLMEDKAFGEQLIFDFLLENRALGMSTPQALTVLMKFQAIEALAKLGDITSIRDLLPSIEPDEIFTEARKAAYIERVNGYLSQFV